VGAHLSAVSAVWETGGVLSETVQRLIGLTRLIAQLIQLSLCRRWFNRTC